MKIRYLLLIVLMMSVVLFPIVSADVKQGHLTLLAVKEGVNSTGSVADLYLEIHPGSGRVFIETFPLTKLDTQISTRFAKEIACDFLDKDCSRYDFIYMIRADSPIVGGPSAGAAASVLTAALLDGKEIDESIAITGTINSGAIIGNVGGVKQKIEAAAANSIRKVLIPRGERFVEDDALGVNSSNKTIDLFAYGENLSIEVSEVTDLAEALFHFTGEEYSLGSGNLTMDQGYQDTMKGLAEQLCNRTNFLQEKMLNTDVKSEIVDDMLDAEESAVNLTNKAGEEYNNLNYYSSASYCFGANVRYATLILYVQNMSKEQAQLKIELLSKSIESFDEKISGKKIKTITDLQAYAIVKERIIEARYGLDEAKEILENNGSAVSNLAYSSERLFSASSWSQFFDNKGKEYIFNNEVLEESCFKKLSEAEERYQYLSQYYLSYLKNTRDEIDNAYRDQRSGEYALCLFKASKAKAQADSIISAIGTEKDNLDEFVEIKSEAVRRVLVSQIDKGIFPIVGYSYYEYANSLKDSEPYSSLLYLEYALELSNYDLYFEQERKGFYWKVDSSLLWIFSLGFFIGVFVSFLIFNRKKNIRKKNLSKADTRKINSRKINSRKKKK